MSNTVIKYRGFELLCHPNTINKYRDGKLGMDKVLIADEIFVSVQKGTRPNSTKLEETFGSSNMKECMVTMLEKGDFPLTTEERKELVKKRRKEIVNYIHCHYVDPKSNLPIPITRIDNALDEMKAKVDHSTNLNQLLKPILKKLPELISIKKQEAIKGTLKIPHRHLGQAYGILGKYADIRSDNYDAEGAIYEVTIVPSDFENLLSNLEKVTQGEYTYESNN